MHSFFKDKDPQRPLVLSFHGTTGTGKNHVSRLIAESIYKKGLESQYVHLKIPTKDYPYESELKAYKETLQNEIQSSVSQCPRQLFILDEVENFPAGLIDVIKPYIDYHGKVEGVDYRQSIFIFLSNVGGREITKILMEHNSTRKSLRINDFEQVLATAAYNTKGGFRHSRLMDSHLIGHYIPFLPLEREHVELCIEEEIIKMGLPPLSEETVAKVIDELQFRPEDTQRFAVKGCKNVREKLNLYVYKQHYSRSKKDEPETKRSDEL
ncbi:torsin-1A-like [Amphiura filiformis]|uniref:torsin-1A-like n=1 Tax=Amphiura filiformis TaxID=82378 RepID=UPI003B21E7F3